MKQFLAAGFLLVALAAPAAAPPASWRLDFYHTGGVSPGVFSADKVVVEPPSRIQQVIDCHAG